MNRIRFMNSDEFTMTHPPLIRLPRQALALAKWQQCLDNSPFYRQILEDGEESIWKEKAADYDETSYPGDQKHIILSQLIPTRNIAGQPLKSGPAPGRSLAPCQKDWK